MMRFVKVFICVYLIFHFDTTLHAQVLVQKQDSVAVTGISDQHNESESSENVQSDEAKKNQTAATAQNKNKGEIKQVKGSRPDMSKARVARPGSIGRPSGSNIPKGTGKPAGVGKPIKK